MASDLSRKGFFNAMVFMFNIVVTTIVGFIITPLLFGYLGPAQFATWKICQRLLSFVSAADGRATQALKWTIANVQDSDDFELKQRQVGSALIVWLRFLPLVLVGGFTIVWFSPSFIGDLDPSMYFMTQITCALLLLNLFLMPLKAIPEAVMVGMNIGYKSNWVESVIAVFSAIVMVVVAYLGWGMIGLGGVMVAAGILGGILKLYLAKRFLKWFAAKKPTKRELKKFFGFSIWIFAWTFVDKLMLSSDLVILGMAASLEEVSVFVFYSYGMYTTITICGLSVSSIIPGLGGLVGKGAYERVMGIYNELFIFIWGCISVCGTTIILLNHSFVKLWIGDDIHITNFENLLLVILMAQLVLIRKDAYIIDVTLDIKNKVIIGFISVVISIALAYVFSMFIFEKPMAGLMLGFIIGRLLLSFYYPIFVIREIRGDILNYLYYTMRPTLVTLAMFAFAYKYQGTFLLTSWFSFVSWLIILSILIIIIVFVLGLNKSQKLSVVKRLQRLPVLKKVL